jgi:hypothetical protein
LEGYGLQKEQHGPKQGNCQKNRKWYNHSMDANAPKPTVNIDGKEVPALLVGGFREKDINAYRDVQSCIEASRRNYEAFMREREMVTPAAPEQVEPKEVGGLLRLELKEGSLVFTVPATGLLHVSSEAPDITNMQKTLKVKSGSTVSIPLGELPPIRPVTVVATLEALNGTCERIEHVVEEELQASDPEAIF